MPHSQPSSASYYFGGADDDELRVLAQQTIATAAGVALRPATVDYRVVRAIAVTTRERIDEPILLPRSRAGQAFRRQVPAPVCCRDRCAPAGIRVVGAAEPGLVDRLFRRVMDRGCTCRQFW